MLGRIFGSLAVLGLSGWTALGSTGGTAAAGIAFSGAVALILRAFGVGLMTSLTPCVYPMIPVTIAILEGSGARTFWHGLRVSLAYLAGMATMYAILGYLVGKMSVMFGSWLANPWVSGGVLLLFWVMSLVLFGIWNPAFLNSGGNLGGVVGKYAKGRGLIFAYLMGFVAGLALSPCMTPTLLTVLTDVSNAGSVALSVVSMVAYAVGSSMLLVVVGTLSATARSVVPRAGGWMEYVKKGLGFVTLWVSGRYMAPIVGEHAARIFEKIVLWAGLAYAAYVLVVLMQRAFRKRESGNKGSGE